MASTKLRIPTLTDDLAATFDEWVNHWTEIGRSCDPADRGKAEAGIAAAYRAARLEPPARVVWVPSPIGGAIARALLIAGPPRDGVGAGVWAGVWDGVWDGVWAGVWAGVWDGVRAGVRDGVGAGVRDGVRDGVWDGVGDGVGAGVGAGVGDGVGAGVGDGVGAGVGAGVRDGVRDGVRAWSSGAIWGQHDAGWIAFYDWFAHHGLADICEPMGGLADVARSAGWWWPHKNLCVITDRPASLFDERVAGTAHRRRLHRSDGPAVTYRDDWAVWSWHGTNVPQWVVEAPTVELIGGETNTEVRRCAIESYGWDPYLRDLGVAPVDQADDPGNPGHQLRLYDLPDAAQLYGERVRLLVMENASRDRDGTRRTYAETVPADMPDAITAAAWQFEVDPNIYRSLARAT